MTLQFGKFKGYEIQDVPDSYLRWLLFDATFLERELLDSVQEEVCRRWPGRLPVRLVEIDWTDFDETQPKPKPDWKLKSVYRRLSQEFHPDKSGGSPLGQQALNRFFEAMENA